ncbi:hypothetical protein [Burkholderia sp. Bp9140]|uniref:hypothetical protein n=1 Tax=Burkholderia sp. Bp9140 TaxID=2184572 RepID=UPI000F57BA5C|nr:hypothetical protein [Burkholderia sp. Bp9140]
MRAINGTLRAAAPIRRWIGPRAEFAAHMTRERLEGLPRHPGARHHATAQTIDRLRDADALTTLDRPKSCVKRRAQAAIRLLEGTGSRCRASPAGPPPPHRRGRSPVRRVSGFRYAARNA